MITRRQFSKMVGGALAAPALPLSALASTTSGIAAAPASGYAYFWADYLTRMHNVCTPQMLQPFLRVNQATALQIHQQLINDNVLQHDGRAHQHLLENRHIVETPSTQVDASSIQFAEKSNYQRIAKLWTIAWLQDQDIKDLPSHSQRELTHYFLNQLKRSRHRVLMALDKSPMKKIIAFAVINKNHIKALGVLPQYQRQGIASELLQRLEQHNDAYHDVPLWIIANQENRALKHFLKSQQWHKSYATDHHILPTPGRTSTTQRLLAENSAGVQKFITYQADSLG